MIRLGTDELQWLAAFERLTGAEATDCVADDQRVCFVVRPGRYRRRAGPDIDGLEQLEKVLGRKVKLVEHSENPTRFLQSAFAPVEVRSVTLEERNGQRRAYVEIPKLYRGLAIGKGGHNIALIRQLARRHLGIHEVVVGAQLKSPR